MARGSAFDQEAGRNGYEGILVIGASWAGITRFILPAQIYEQIVLDEEIDLSYPFVFRAGSALFMVPQSRGSKGLRLLTANESEPTQVSNVSVCAQ
jgi:hypothetical protein